MGLPADRHRRGDPRDRPGLERTELGGRRGGRQQARLGPLLVGEDPSRIEYLWTKLYTSFSSLGSLGFVSAIISGVDIALWDVRGKQLGLPIYELLGGRFRDDLRLYSNGWFRGCETPADFARAAKETVDVGHSAIKLDPSVATAPSCSATAPATTRSTSSRRSGSSRHIAVDVLEFVVGNPDRLTTLLRSAPT